MHIVYLFEHPSLASTVNLKGENGFLAVVMLLEKPTYSDITKIAKALQDYMKGNFHENYTVQAENELGGIEVIRNAVPKVTIMLSVTKPPF